MTIELLFHQLHKEMTERVFLKNNPVLKQVKEGVPSPQFLAEVIRQYVCFPEEIVNMLKGAAEHFPVSHPIHEELKRNWGQENGSATGGVPHVKILQHNLKRDLLIDADDVRGSAATKKFLSTVLNGMKEDTWFAVGQAYALEASAVPELAIILGPALNTYASLIGKSQPIQKVALVEKGNYALPHIRTEQEAYEMEMSDWFALHIVDFEVGHRDFLREKISTVLLEDADQTEFARGFRAVLDAMDIWWESLSKGK